MIVLLLLLSVTAVTAQDPSGIDTIMRNQWKNPSGILAILLVIGGDLVGTALAQHAGRGRFVPVAFSFGWVAYSFGALKSAFCDGRLLPLPNFPSIVINSETGYSRNNESWVLSR